MFRGFIALTVSLILFSTTFLGQSVAAQTIKESASAARARADVKKLGLGKNARVDVKLQDKSKISGYISDTAEESFTITDPKTGATQAIAYTDVQNVKKHGGGLSTRSWLIIGGAAAAAIIVGIIVKPAFCDGGAQTRFPC